MPLDEIRLRHVTLAVAALLFAACAATGIVLDLRPVAGLRARAQWLVREVERERRSLEERPRLEAEIAALEATRRAQALRLPAQARLDEFVAQAGGAARRHGV